MSKMSDIKNIYDTDLNSDVPQWIKQLEHDDEVMIFFPTDRLLAYSIVLDNYISESKDHMSILTVVYTSKGTTKLEELLYDNYACGDENSWHAFQIM